MERLLVSVFGDSISTFEGFVPAENHVYYEGERAEITGVTRVEDTWWMQVIEHLGGEFLANASFSGSMVEGIGFPAGVSPERIAQIAGRVDGVHCQAADGERCVADGESVQTGGVQHPDVILVFMGTNDYGWGNAENQMAARSAAAPTCADYAQIEPRTAGLASEADVERFGQSYEQMLASMRTAYPHADVWCLTLLPGRERGKSGPAFTYALRGISLDVYNQAMREAAARQGCRTVDVRAVGFDYEASDGTHPTKRGMRQIAAMAIAQLEGIEPADVFPAEGLFPESMRSQRWCQREECVTCAYARGVGNQWSCVCDAPRVP